MVQICMWVEQLLNIPKDGADVASNSLFPDWEVFSLFQSVELMGLKRGSVGLIPMMLWLMIAMLMALWA